MRGIKKVEFTTDWDGTTGTFTEIPIDEILLDSTDIGSPAEYATEKSDNIEDLDGIKWTGLIRVQHGTTELPADNTAFHLRVTPHSGTTKVYGGTDGARGFSMESGLRSLNTGRAFIDFKYTFVAINNAGGIADQ